uniref:uncharacterized protein LOC120338356 n=1 Tax=Styela clava TaxID=7725 RepID=UPI001939842E|nr:uncharacterized protein LOC120338356 [Styela clava]
MKIWAKIFLLALSVFGNFALEKVPDGVCVRKLVNGKLVSVGSCEENSGGDIINEIKKRVQGQNVKMGNCDVMYKSKCFKYVPALSGAYFKFDAAKGLCTGIGGKFANIYDVTHYRLIESYLRTKIKPSWSVIYVWTGLSYQNQKFFLSTGEEVNFPPEYWYDQTPKNDPTWTRTHLYVSKDLNSSIKGIAVPPPTSDAYGALCEI